jgi:hypothetical protein
VIVDKIRERHRQDVFGIVSTRLVINHNRVSDDILDIISTHRATESHKLHLYWSGTQGKDFIPAALRVSIQIDKNIDAVIEDHPSGIGKVQVGDVAEDIGASLNGSAACAAVWRSEGVAENFKDVSVVHGKDTLHEIRERMVTEIGGDISQTDPRSGR